MGTVGQQVEVVRSMLRGSMSDELSTLDDDYTVGAGTVTLRYPKPNLQPGSVLSVGLNTFYALAVTSNGTSITVQPSIDGGPEADAPHGEIVRIKPAHTTWAIFREWSRCLESLSSPEVGLYGTQAFDVMPDFHNNVYPLPTDVGTPWATLSPIRLLSATYQIRGFDQWQPVVGAEWQPDHGVVRVYGRTPNAGFLRFVFAFPYAQPTDLTTTTLSLGLSDYAVDIPGLGAAAYLALTDEARRQQPFAQGDPRRAAEIAPGANIGVSRMFAAQQQQRVNQEAARLAGVWGYRMTVGVSGD